MKIQSTQTQMDAAHVVDDRLLMLEVVDFKWLMAGQGWWVDETRLHSDPHYAAHLLEIAEHSELPSLQHCAMQLHAAKQQLHRLENH